MHLLLKVSALGFWLVMLTGETYKKKISGTNYRQLLTAPFLCAAIDTYHLNCPNVPFRFPSHLKAPLVVWVAYREEDPGTNPWLIWTPGHHALHRIQLLHLIIKTIGERISKGIPPDYLNAKCLLCPHWKTEAPYPLDELLVPEAIVTSFILLAS